MAIASIAIVDGPAPGHEEFVAAVRERLPIVPRYSQRVRRFPFDLARPVWVDVRIDLDFHIRRTALPAPGDDAALFRLVGRAMSQRLDRDRPMWECWVVEGLPKRRWAVLSKVHNSMVDGVSGSELYRVLFDTTARPVGNHTVRRPSRPAPGPLSLYADAVLQLARFPIDQARLACHALPPGHAGSGCRRRRAGPATARVVAAAHRRILPVGIDRPVAAVRGGPRAAV